jgi:hypothetical protein
VIQPPKGSGTVEQRFKASSVASDPDHTQINEQLEPAELTLLRQFFELLADWEESQKEK